MKIEFDAEKHEYKVNGEKVPSVSDILSPLSAERYDKLNPAVLSATAARGTAVHEATQMVDYGIETDEEIPEIEPYMMAYQAFLFDHEVEWEMIEQKVGYYRYKGEQPLYCGKVDRYGKVDGEDAVVDIKTYASLTTDAMLSASCQTMLYKCAIFSEKELDGMAKELLELIQTKVSALAAQELADARQKEMEENASKQSDSPAVESTEPA